MQTVPVDISIEADCGHSLSLITPHVHSVDRPQWFSEIAEWKRRYPFYYSPHASPDAPLKPQAVVQELNKQVEAYKERVIITTGVGQHQMWAAQWYRWRYPRSFITSGGLGTMGYGLPSAIGAKVALPHMMVIDIDGDASLSMTAMELMTAAEFGVKVKVLVLNNNFQGMVKVSQSTPRHAPLHRSPMQSIAHCTAHAVRRVLRFRVCCQQWQDLFYNKRYSSTAMKNPDWVKFAGSMNVKGIKVSRIADLPAAMHDFLTYDDGPVLMEAVVDDNEHVYPMVPGVRQIPLHRTAQRSTAQHVASILLRFCSPQRPSCLSLCPHSRLLLACVCVCAVVDVAGQGAG